MPRPPVRRAGAGLVPVHRLPLPPGCTEGMREASRDAAVRRALGNDLAMHLVRAHAVGRRVTLFFAGSGWEENLASLVHDLERRLAQALGRAALELEVRSLPERSAPNAATVGGATSADPLERLRRAATRLLARRS